MDIQCMCFAYSLDIFLKYTAIENIFFVLTKFGEKIC